MTPILESMDAIWSFVAGVAWQVWSTPQYLALAIALAEFLLLVWLIPRILDYRRKKAWTPARQAVVSAILGERKSVENLELAFRSWPEDRSDYTRELIDNRRHLAFDISHALRLCSRLSDYVNAFPEVVEGKLIRPLAELHNTAIRMTQGLSDLNSWLEMDDDTVEEFRTLYRNGDWPEDREVSFHEIITGQLRPGFRRISDIMHELERR